MDFQLRNCLNFIESNSNSFLGNLLNGDASGGGAGAEDIDAPGF